MRKKVIVFMILCVCANMPAMAVSYNIGSFTAPKGADGTNGINGTNGTDGTAGCSPRIYQTNKTGGCYQIKSQAQKRVSGVCTDDTSINAVTLDNICDGCTPTYSKKYIHGSVSSPTYNDTSANAIGTRVTVSGCGEGSVDIDTYDGDDGTSFNYLGTVASCGALPTNPTPSPNDAYLVKGNGLGRVCIYSNGWPTCPDDCAEFTGPAGDNNCTGLESSNNAVKNTTLTYSGPTKSDSGLSYYTTKGKMTTSHTPCNPNVTIDDSVQDDSCTLIAAPSGSTCTGSNKTYYECKTQAADGNLAKGATYNLCVSTAGDSISNALDPCAGNTNSSTIIKTTSTTAYSRGTKNGNLYPNIGFKTVTKTACDGTTTYTTTEQDSCVEIAKPANVCTAATSAYLRCYNDQASSDKTYYVCQDLGGGNNSLANKIDGKIDASYLTTNGYLTSSSNLNADKLTGTINAGRLPNTVVITGNSGSNSIEKLLETEIDNTNGVFKDFVTGGDLTTAVSAEVESRLDTAISEKTVTFGGVSMTLDEALELLGAAAGTCTRGGLGGADGTVSCSGGGLGSVSTTGKD